MTESGPMFARRIADATAAVFGESPISQEVALACQRFEEDIENIRAGRMVKALVLGIVGAKGQGKTWCAQQFLRDRQIRNLLRSGDLREDATTRLVWIGPVPPDGLDASCEVYHHCASSQMIEIGQPYVILDTPGLTDSDHRAAQIGSEALSLSPIKILVIARDQIRAAANMTLAHQIEGSVCVPVISSVEPEELDATTAGESLAEDLRSLRDQLALMAPSSTLAEAILVPDFEITGDEEASSQAFTGAMLDRMSQLGITEQQIANSRELRIKAAGRRLREAVHTLIADELPQLASAVDQLARETEFVPQRVMSSLLGSESVLQTGVRMRLRARLVGDTSLVWFPYRTVMSTLNLTQGAWDRVVLAMAGSVPSLFGALASWARNVKQNREFSDETRDGIRRRTQEQVEQRLRPLCEQFHRTVMKLRPREERSSLTAVSSGMRLRGVEELQVRSQEIFDTQLERRATPNWLVQVYALIGVTIFWMFMAGPIVLIYREYFMTSLDVLQGNQMQLDDFPHPTAGLLFTSLFLSLLPLALYCMIVFTFSLSKRKVRSVTNEIVAQHNLVIDQLKDDHVIHLEFDDELLQQAEFLLNVGPR